MTFKSNRASPLCCFKLCASFDSHWWIQTGVTVRKRPISVKNRRFFLAVRPWNLMDDLEKQYGTSSKRHQALCIISSPYVNSNWSYGPETAKWGHDLCDPDHWPLTLNFCVDITSVNSNISRKFKDDTMRGTLSKRCDGRIHGQTERSVLRAAWSQLKMQPKIDHHLMLHVAYKYISFLAWTVIHLRLLLLYTPTLVCGDISSCRPAEMAYHTEGEYSAVKRQLQADASFGA